VAGCLLELDGAGEGAAALGWATDAGEDVCCGVAEADDDEAAKDAGVGREEEERAMAMFGWKRLKLGSTIILGGGGSRGSPVPLKASLPPIMAPPSSPSEMPESKGRVSTAISIEKSGLAVLKAEVP
jgi:hypothetical protein